MRRYEVTDEVFTVEQGMDKIVVTKAQYERMKDFVTLVIGVDDNNYVITAGARQPFFRKGETFQADHPPHIHEIMKIGPHTGYVVDQGVWVAPPGWTIGCSFDKFTEFNRENGIVLVSQTSEPDEKDRTYFVTDNMIRPFFRPGERFLSERPHPALKEV